MSYENAICCPSSSFAGLNPRGSCPTLGPSEADVMDEINVLKREVASLESLAAAARQLGQETVAQQHFRSALALTQQVTEQMTDSDPHQDRLEALRLAALLALNCGEVAEARRLLDEARAADAATAYAEEWAQLHDVEKWE